MTEKIQPEVMLSSAERAEQIRKNKQLRPYDGLTSRFPNLPVRTGFKTHWFNDAKGKIQRKLEEGWEFSKRVGYKDTTVNLEEKPNTRIRCWVGTKKDGSTLYAYAMDLPLEIWGEYEAAKMKEVDEREKVIRREPTEHGAEVHKNEVTQHKAKLVKT